MTVLLVVLAIVGAAAAWSYFDAKHATRLMEERRRQEEQKRGQRELDTTPPPPTSTPSLVSVLKNVTRDQRADLSALEDTRWN